MSYHLQGLADRLRELIVREPRKCLKAFCEDLKISRHTAQRALRLCLGMSFRELQRKALVQLVDRLLAESSALSIKEIAFRTGFKSESSFGHFVRRTLGVTPTEYRHRNEALARQRKANSTSAGT
jgi:AraC-like DNA-binding protein